MRRIRILYALNDSDLEDIILTSCQISVPRISYLPFLLERVHAFFRTSVLDASIPITNAWFDVQDLPLKWHYPIGLLHDLYSGVEHADEATVQTQQASNDAGINQVSSLPWKLTLHYSGFPFEHLFQLDDQGKVLIDAFVNSVKEADFIRNGSAKTFMSLSKNDSDTLWKAVESRE